MNKLLVFLETLSIQNCVEAQYLLGKIYYNNSKTIDDDKAIFFYKMAANQNHGKSCFKLFKIYFKNNEIRESIYYLELAAQNNHVVAQHMLGAFYNMSKYVPRDISKSIYYFTLAADQNYSDSQLALGLLFFMYKDIPKSIYYLEKAANNNKAMAMIFLGDISLNNEMIPHDFNKSLFYYEKAVELDFALANSYNIPRIIGIIYYNKEYIPRDIDKAIYYFELSSRYDDIISIYYLAMIYDEKLNNPQKALFHLMKLKAHPHIYKDPRDFYTLLKSLKMIGLIHATCDSFFDIEIAIEYLIESYFAFANETYHNLGIIFYFYKNDFSKAKYLLKKSIERRFSISECILAIIYQDRKNFKKAGLHYFRFLQKYKISLKIGISQFCLNTLVKFSIIQIFFYSFIIQDPDFQYFFSEFTLCQDTEILKIFSNLQKKLEIDGISVFLKKFVIIRDFYQNQISKNHYQILHGKKPSLLIASFNVDSNFYEGFGS
ncbi:hypothetical protein TRFO_27992 [Tritrichomonas foetus]|uniref:Uncharacterized protein n=1 Tax=Tritrichomonas foetus TaxID=1144522 RepID=A0A1J4JZX7_9EUKA|nr:hypothetical protein TRFO_27992 [Tritrichomonas foetus]|eukprot:OHT04539.1 hypothetical protein TRFO_27992 [Tritrichomonas foetus]